jgi:predicted aldo/keto reductase-like oxidoreductase
MTQPTPTNSTAAPFPRNADLAPDLPPVCRLGLATRGNTHLTSDLVHRAIDAGVNYHNWCGHPDGLSQAIRRMPSRLRDQLVIATQLNARTASAADREMDEILTELNTDRIDVVTLYYVEQPSEWDQITAPTGALAALRHAKQAGRLRLIGLTTHQRPLAARIADTGLIDLLMIRYNAAHRGAETDIFPTTRAKRIPIVAFTGQRWGALAKPTPADPSGFLPPAPKDWYRFVLANSDITVALMAPNGPQELDENLHLLHDWQRPSEIMMQTMRDHGDRVHRSAGHFP